MNLMKKREQKGVAVVPAVVTVFIALAATIKTLFPLLFLKKCTTS